MHYTDSKEEVNRLNALIIISDESPGGSLFLKMSLDVHLTG
jgi:hypothetical protein